MRKTDGKEKEFLFADAMIVVGFLLLCSGMFLLNKPAALIVAGLLLLYAFYYRRFCK